MSCGCGSFGAVGGFLGAEGCSLGVFEGVVGAAGRRSRLVGVGAGFLGITHALSLSGTPGRAFGILGPFVVFGFWFHVAPDDRVVGNVRKMFFLFRQRRRDWSCDWRFDWSLNWRFDWRFDWRLNWSLNWCLNWCWDRDGSRVDDFYVRVAVLSGRNRRNRRFVGIGYDSWVGRGTFSSATSTFTGPHFDICQR